jgi:zinc/manganese transport system substrate-binding protein
MNSQRKATSTLAAMASTTVAWAALVASGAGALPAGAAVAPKTVAAVGAENQYANVISQVGGRYVNVEAIINNPNTDPHEFEANASVVALVSRAQLVVQNGMGYDTFMNKIEGANRRPGRLVVVAQDLLGMKATAFNPHLWYDPKTMPLVAQAIAADLSKLQPAHASYFRANEKHFVASLRPWLAELAHFKSKYKGTPVAVTEPVADYMLQAAGADIKTPKSLQSAVMNGTDPSPQDVSTEDTLIRRHQVKAFLYNRQVTDTLTASFLAAAKRAHVPVVALYETMPVPGYNYQSWMQAETEALQRAVATGKSTDRL